jgi:hypothetical protein
MESEASLPAEDNVAYLQFVPVRDDADFHLLDEKEEPYIVDDFCAGLQLQSEVTDVIHGTLGDKGEPATLLLIRLRFLGFTSERRLQEVELVIRFEDAKKRPFSDPEVVDLWPDGEYILNETNVNVENTTEVSSTFGGGSAGVTATVGARWERKTTSSRVDRARLTGTRWREGNARKRHAVRFFVTENKSREDGVPSEILTSILLKRRDDEKEFSGHVRVRAEAGQFFKAKWIYKGLGGKRIISASVFDSRTSAKTSDVKKDKLANEDLGALSGVPPPKTSGVPPQPSPPTTTSTA